MEEFHTVDICRFFFLPSSFTDLGLRMLGVGYASEAWVRNLFETSTIVLCSQRSSVMVLGASVSILHEKGHVLDRVVVECPMCVTLDFARCVFRLVCRFTYIYLFVFMACERSDLGWEVMLCAVGG